LISQDSCCLVSRTAALLLDINDVPEAFGAQKSLHLFAPGSVIVAVKGLNGFVILTPL